MEKAEAIIERQKIDCNCNDCKFLVRSFELKQKDEDSHEIMQLKAFHATRVNLLKKADQQTLKHLRGQLKNLVMQIVEIEHADFSLVKIKHGTPHCKVHGAMNKITKDGIWRCIVITGFDVVRSGGSVSKKHKETICRAGCYQTKNNWIQRLFFILTQKN